ncbi:hypothetical protein IGI04_025773 [Brassica rapa subsp. trilocularis]|uniref:Beta-galactosidase galactose-binding domain-containing protein n=1 Tax=Brassica rapa subsp. trilocularis TaxID=1813537 RepID=A0ABQ7KY03_BRACM|nr:hypothetical protein IGI04_025773 [Brassica rapa subsp. trilocularis]
MSWYKTTFKALLENDPVVIDLLGLRKGTTWFNRNNIGHYWPAFISNENGCSENVIIEGIIMLKNVRPIVANLHKDDTFSASY